MSTNTHCETSPGKPLCFPKNFLLLAGLLAIAGTAGPAAAWDIRQLATENSGSNSSEIRISKQTKPWTFVMMGDTRGHHDTTTGVSVVLAPIATKIAELCPNLVLCCGDQINGDATNGLTPLSYAQMFDNWKTAMSPVIASNIPIYTVRGNHENNADEGPPLLAVKQAYYDALGTNMPGNGPNNGP